MPRFFSHKGHSGSALIIVLWAVVLLGFAVAIASEKVGLVMGDAAIRARRVQAELLAQSSFTYLDKILQDERKHNLETGKGNHAQGRRLDLNRFQGIWHSEKLEAGGGTFWIEIEDEQSRINWIKTPSYVWRNLFRSAGLKPEQVDAWFDCLTDWQDADDVRSLNGAETFDYEALKENPRKAKNAPVTEMGELYWIMGGAELLDLQVPVDFDGNIKPLLPYTTIDGDGKININTAPPFLIAAALDLPIEKAEQIVQKRWGPDGIEGTEDDVYLDGLPDVQGQTTTPQAGTPAISPTSSAITTSSNYFRVRGVGEFQEQHVVCEALAVRDGQGGLTLLRLPRTIEKKKAIAQDTSL